MSHVSVEGLAKSYAGRPPTVAVDDLDLEIHDGEFVVLLGPSGCGKTTTLRCLAGLEHPTAGRISLAGTTVFDSGGGVYLPPNKRSIGMVFQSYALWPHMTVRRNIEYPLRVRGMRARIGEGWVEAIARLVDCEALLDRHPAQLSGGQQQRIALARGLVARPNLVLLDEPLSNLDARLRDAVRMQLHELHMRLGFTAVFVTHDQTEALALGDRLAIMRGGRIEQFDTPEVVFDHPATDYVAEFVGMSNLLRCQRSADGWTCNGEAVVGEPPAAVDARSGNVGVRIRPDDLRISPATGAPTAGRSNVRARVVDAEFGGRHVNVVLEVGGDRVTARLAAGGFDSWERKLQPDEPVWLHFQASDGRYFGPTP